MSSKIENFILKSNLTNHEIQLSNLLHEITERDLTLFGIKIPYSNNTDRVIFKLSMINKIFSVVTYKEFPLRLLLRENSIEREKINMKNSIEIINNVSSVKIFFIGLLGNDNYLYTKSENDIDISSSFESDKENYIFWNEHKKRNKENQNTYESKFIRKEPSIKPNLLRKEPSSNISNNLKSNVHLGNTLLNTCDNKLVRKDKCTEQKNDIKMSHSDVGEIIKKKAIIIEDEEEIPKKIENVINISSSMQELDELFQKYANTTNLDLKCNENLKCQFSEYNGNSKRKRNHNINRIIIDKDSYTIDDAGDKELIDNNKVPIIKNVQQKENEEMSFTSENKIGKRLKKANNILLNTPISQNCTICLEQMKNKTHLDTCKHEFCKDCIENWAKMTNVCPLCKVEFKKMIFYDKNREMKKYVKRKKLEYEEEVESWLENCQESCMVCDNSNDEHLMLVCDRCSFYVCHTYCAGLDIIPEGEWICSNCSGENNNNTTRRRARNKRIQTHSAEDSSGKEETQRKENIKTRRMRSKKAKNYEEPDSLDDFIVDNTDQAEENIDNDDEEFEESVIVEKSNIKSRLRSHISKDKKNGVNRRLKSKNSKYRY